MIYSDCRLIFNNQKGGNNLTNTLALRRAIEKQGLKYKFIAKEMGLSPYGLQKKIENDTEFKVSEVDKLTKMLNLSSKQKEEIFFAK